MAKKYNIDMKRVIGIGETVLDILFKDDQPQKAVPGGSTFNTRPSTASSLSDVPVCRAPW